MTAPRLLPGQEERASVVRRPGAAARVLIVSNRLPCTVHVEDDQVRLVRSTGGLATGLCGLREGRSALWIGWSGTPAELPAPVRQDIAHRLAEVDALGVPLREREIAAFYERFANGVLWPILHDQDEHPDPDPDDWTTYRRVNARYADVVAAEARPGDRVWVHDYHLMLVPRLLRELRPDLRIGFFLHTPFPDAAALATLPQRAALLQGVLGADVVGFHTPAYASRFAEAVEMTLGHPSALAAGAGEIDLGDRRVGVHACAMSVDAEAFGARAEDPRVLARAAELRAAGGPLFVGVDRLDYTKGIPERLLAFERLLDERPALCGQARLLQLAVPSREDVPAYRALRTRVESLVARINERFGTRAWRPVQYVYGTVDPIELSAMYRAADVMLVTPLRDGMNLVAKEFVATRTDDEGVLILGEHAGAAAELRAALLVDSRDVFQLTDACGRALDMSAAERRVRMRRMRARVTAHDVRRWGDECLARIDDVEHASPRRRTTEL
ncbi:MAG: alpha,alpha-trehalose-phosphate synthase (UDP-forming) [Gemmatirosa sp.]